MNLYYAIKAEHIRALDENMENRIKRARVSSERKFGTCSEREHVN